MSVFRKTVLMLACLALFAIGAHASVPAVYIAQSAAGAANGADCADAKPISFFDSAGNWGSGSAQIGPGTTVHFCGMFAGTAGGNMATVRGSGASGNPIILLLEPGASFTAPYWNPSGGAIGCSGYNYITVDGGTNGIVQNSANGTSLTYQANSTGVDFENCGYSEVRNLSVQNIYVHSGTGADTNGIGIADHGIANSASIHNNIVMWGGDIGIDANYVNGANSILIYNNTTDYSVWGMAIGDQSGGSNSASGIQVYGNAVGPHFDIMLDAGGAAHHGDGIIVNSPGPTGVLSYSSFYNNYIHGDLSANPSFNSTAYLFIGGVLSHIDVYNNVIGQDSLNAGAGGPEGLIRIANLGYATFANGRILNNTFYGINGSPAAIKFDGGNFLSENNIFLNVNQAYLDNVAGPITITSNYNDFYGLRYVASYLGGVYYPTFASWQAAGFDAGPNGSNTNPLLNSNYAPQSASAAIGLGANLSSLGVASLDSDKAGTPRPASGSWIVGAYQTGVAGPEAPSGLTATVQ